MSDKLKAIETIYKGYKFRSRLEARWAVFFDALNISWEYEKEGYDLDGIYYLPDFWLPSYQYWFEIKGQTPTDEEKFKCKKLNFLSEYPVVLAVGEPHLNENIVYSCDMNGSGGGYGEWLNARWFFCPNCAVFDFGIDPTGRATICTYSWKHVGLCECLSEHRIGNFPALIAAYNAAKQSRFEFGQSGN